MTPLTDTPEIRLAFQVNAPGSLIPTVQLRALVEAVEAARPFAFFNAPDRFNSDDGGCTEALIDDADVQRLRAALSSPAAQAVGEREGEVVLAGNLRPLSPPAHPGWVLVPREPTEVMTVSGACIVFDSLERAASVANPPPTDRFDVPHLAKRGTAAAVYRAMLAASPNPPVGGNESNGSSLDHDPSAGSALEALRRVSQLAEHYTFVAAGCMVNEQAVRQLGLGFEDIKSIAAALSSAKQTPGDSSRDELKSPSGSALKPTPPPEVARLVEELRDAGKPAVIGQSYQGVATSGPSLHARAASALESLALSEGRMMQTLATLIEKWESDAWVTDQDEMARLARQALSPPDPGGRNE